MSDERSLEVRSRGANTTRTTHPDRRLPAVTQPSTTLVGTVVGPILGGPARTAAATSRPASGRDSHSQRRLGAPPTEVPLEEAVAGGDGGGRGASRPAVRSLPPWQQTV